jgi:predicted dehydrogenase
MTVRRVGIIMNGVTGRMGLNQHLIRSILAIREQGGVPLPDGDVIYPDPILVGRNEKKLRAIAQAHNVERWSTSLEECLANPQDTLYFDALTTAQRAPAVRAAIAAGKHIYCEKPLADTLATSLELARLARQAGAKTGIVHDKLFLPGLRKLKRLADSGFFGRIFAIRVEFGYWVFEGGWQAAQRPSWNYRKEEGGGIIVDMFSHWQYVLGDLFGPVKSVSCVGAIHLPERVDEQGRPYTSTAEDAAYATMELEGGIIASVNSSWCVRVYRDELFQIQVDGTLGSAVAGLRDCKSQHRVNTPKPVWNPDIPNPFRFRDDWETVPDNAEFDNGFKVQWEMFLKHVVLDTPFKWDFLDAARGVQLAEIATQSWQERRWVDVPPLTL